MPGVDYSKFDNITTDSSDEDTSSKPAVLLPSTRADRWQQAFSVLDEEELTYDAKQADHLGELEWSKTQWKSFIEKNKYPEESVVNIWIHSPKGKLHLDDFYCGGIVLHCHEKMRAVYELGHAPDEDEAYKKWASRLLSLREDVIRRGGLTAAVQNFRILRGLLRSKALFGPDRPEGLLCAMATEAWTDKPDYQHHEYMHWISNHPFPEKDKVMRFCDEYQANGGVTFPELYSHDLQNFLKYEEMKAIFQEGFSGEAVARAVGESMSCFEEMRTNYLALCSVTRSKHYYGKRPPFFVDLVTVHLNHWWCGINGWAP